MLHDFILFAINHKLHKRPGVVHGFGSSTRGRGWLHSVGSGPVWSMIESSREAGVTWKNSVSKEGGKNERKREHKSLMARGWR